MRYVSMLLLLCLSAVAAEKAAYDSDGRIIALLSEADDVDVVSNVVAVLPNDKRIPLQVRRWKPDYSYEGVRRQGHALAWSGPIELPNGGKGRLDLKAEEDAAGVRYTSRAIALSWCKIFFINHLQMPHSKCDNYKVLICRDYLT